MGQILSSEMSYWLPNRSLVKGISNLSNNIVLEQSTTNKNSFVEFSDFVTECKPGDFDYYLLSMSYAPDFCKLNPDKSKTPECDGNYNLVLHGLWPQYSSPRVIDGHKFDYPQFCKTNVKKEEVLATLSNISDWQTIGPEYQELILHEWTRHGSCSGLMVQDYFNMAFKLARLVPNPKIPDDSTPEQLSKLFPNGYIQYDKDNTFSGVVFHFTKDGNLQDL
jgi:ribonuclease I